MKLDVCWRQEALLWPVLVDDLAGTVHRAYSGEDYHPVRFAASVRRPRVPRPGCFGFRKGLVIFL